MRDDSTRENDDLTYDRRLFYPETRHTHPHPHTVGEDQWDPVFLFIHITQYVYNYCTCRLRLPGGYGHGLVLPSFLIYFIYPQ